MKKRIMAVFSVTLLVLCVFSVSTAFAKYITEKGKQSEVSSLEFFFTSDYLSGNETPEYRIYSNSVKFEIRNYIDSLRVNASNIDYTVSANGGTLSSAGGTLVAQNQNTVSNEITLSYSGEETEKEIIVTATSSSPYVKELKAKFVFMKSALIYEISDSPGSYYADLYIHTGDTDQPVTVKVNWGETNLLIDETNDYVFGKLNEYKNSASINIPAYTTVKISFFKNDIEKDYSCGETKFVDTINMPTAAEGS